MVGEGDKTLLLIRGMVCVMQRMLQLTWKTLCKCYSNKEVILAGFDNLYLIYINREESL